MKTNILIITGHPDSQSYCAALSDAYRKGAAENGKVQVREIDLGKIDFDPELCSTVIAKERNSKRI